MYESIISMFKNIKDYITTIIYGDKETQNLRIIYKENNININELYSGLKKIQPKLYNQTNIDKILFYIKKEIEYDNQLNHYEKILDINVDIDDQVKRIERTTYLKHLKENFQKIQLINNEYKNNQDKNKKDN